MLDTMEIVIIITGDTRKRQFIIIILEVTDTVEWRRVRASRSRTTVATAAQSARTRSSLADTLMRSVSSLRDSLVVTFLSSSSPVVEPSCGSAAPAPSTTSRPATSARCAASLETSDLTLTRGEWSQLLSLASITLSSLRARECHAASVL